MALKSVRAYAIPTLPASTIEQLEQHANGQRPWSRKKRLLLDAVLAACVLAVMLLVGVMGALLLTGGAGVPYAPVSTPTTYGYPATDPPYGVQ